MSKPAYYFHSSRSEAKPKMPQKRLNEDFDSADELDDTGMEDKSLSQKVPESLINMNNFSSNRCQTDQSGFLIKEKSMNSRHHSRNMSEGKDELLDETIKRMLCKSPQKVVSEYLYESQNSIRNNHIVQPERTRISSLLSKKTPYSSNQSYQRNQENFGGIASQSYSVSGKESNKTYDQKFTSNNQSIKTNFSVLEGQDILWSRDRVQISQDFSNQSWASRLNTEKEAEPKTKHKRALENTQLNKERECFFVSNDKADRNFEQFLEDQNKFHFQPLIKKKEHQEQPVVAPRSFEGGLHKPEINAHSLKIMENKNNESLIAHKRNDSGKVTRNKLLESISARGVVLSDKNLKQGEPAETLLHSDAFRRNNKMIQESPTKHKPTSNNGMSSKSKKAFAKKFIQEFDIVILEFLEEGKEPVLNQIQLSQLLQKLKFLKASEQTEKSRFETERLLLDDIWSTLFGEKFQGIHRRNLLVLLLSILNLHFPITKIPKVEPNISITRDILKYSSPERESNILSYVSPQRDNLSLLENGTIGSFDEDENYILTEEEVKKIHKKFQVLYFNRLSAIDPEQLISSKNSQPQLNSSSSKNLAQTCRQGLKDGKLSQAELLILSKKLNEEKRKRYEEVLQEDEAKRSFKRQTNQYNYVSGHKPEIQSMTSSDRTHELYLLNQPQQNKMKNDLSSQTISSPKFYQETTSLKFDSANNNLPETPRIEENNEDQERIPLLVVDVNLGPGQADKIVVHEGDTAEDLAEIFTVEHGLDLSMKTKLKALLEFQMAGLLSKIDEEATSMCSETDRHHHNNLDY